jgi:poly(A) RNA polymerase
MYRLSRHGEHVISYVTGIRLNVNTFATSAVWQVETNNKTKEQSEESNCQTTSDTFDRMLMEGKQWAKNSILLTADGRDNLASADEMSSQIGSKIDYCQYFRSKDKRLCLLHLDHFRPYSALKQKLTKGSLSTLVFPLKSRVFHQTGRVESAKNTIKNSSVYSLKDSRSDELILSNMSQLKDWRSQIDFLAERLLMNELELKLRFFIITQLEEILCQGVFDQFEIIPFGSSVNSFGKRNSDLDLVLVPRPEVAPEAISLPSNWQPFCRRIENDRFLTQRCISILHEQIQLIPGTVGAQKIPMARVPIVKFTSNLTDIDVDVSIQFSREIGAWSIAHVLFECSRICPSLVHLVTFLRQWARQKELTNKAPGPWITNFSLIMLLVSFLQIQKQPLLPPIKHLGVLPDTKRINLSAYSESNANSNFAELLQDFFLHLSKFDFDNYGFNVYDGECIVKPDFTAMHVQNPLERDLNITKNVGKRNLKQLVLNAQDSYRIIESHGTLNLNTLLSTRNGNVVIRNRKPVKVQDLFEMS